MIYKQDTRWQCSLVVLLSVVMTQVTFFFLHGTLKIDAELCCIGALETDGMIFILFHFILFFIL